jgi:hypothetical protein
LRIFEANGLEIEKQVPIVPVDGSKPITVADFVVKGQRRAIYVDGAAFHRGERLRRDRLIRQSLREAEPAWEVITLTAKDLARGSRSLVALLGEGYALPEAPPSPQALPGTESDASQGAAVSSVTASGLEVTHPRAEEQPRDYELLDQLDGGGMAECYRARHRESGDVVFFKRVRLGSDDAAALQREAHIYAKLQYITSEHLLQVRELVRSDEHVALVTDFADGGDLKHNVESRALRRVAAAEAAAIALEVAQGLADLHDNGIVHRDLKPENVLRCSGKWKLADFGIAKSQAQGFGGRTFKQAGTYGYAAPEQFEGTEAHPSADVYSFGKLMVFLLTGGTDLDRVPVEYSDLRRLVFRCASPMAEGRPAIQEVVALLEAISGP